MTLYILEILLRESLENASLILNIFFILPLDTWAYNYLLSCKFLLDILFFMKYFDFSNMLLLGLRGMEGGILEMSACLSLSLSRLDGIFLLEGTLLNWADIHYLNILLFLLAVSLFQPDS